MSGSIRILRTRARRSSSASLALSGLRPQKIKSSSWSRSTSLGSAASSTRGGANTRGGSIAGDMALSRGLLLGLLLLRLLCLLRGGRGRLLVRLLNQ